MYYLGGKYRIRVKLANYLEKYRKPGQVYLEPFVGSAWVVSEISGSRFAGDYCKELIDMYIALQGGWLPPDSVSEDEYRYYKAGNGDSHIRAFVGFGCSFGGKWFAGYARNSTIRNYTLNAKRSLLRRLPRLRTVKFEYKSYDCWQPKDMLVYCDPPYKNTCKAYGVKEEFDHDKFWDTMRIWSKDNTVFISEYKAPSDFTCVAEFETKTDLQTKSGKEKRVERLFRYYI